MSERAMNMAKLLDMLPDQEQALAYEMLRRIILAWDPDYTKLTPAELEELREAEREAEFFELTPHDKINWDA